VLSDPEGVRVTVDDTGEGISSEDAPYVFDRFYRGEKSRSRATGGAGLGLAIAKGIIEAHGGQIGLESAIEQGARFYFTLPVKSGRSAELTAAT
jgi:signal transduction histidine kinase